MNIKENYHIRPDSHVIVGRLLGDLDNIYSFNSQVASICNRQRIGIIRRIVNQSDNLDKELSRYIRKGENGNYYIIGNVHRVYLSSRVREIKNTHPKKNLFETARMINTFNDSFMEFVGASHFLYKEFPYMQLYSYMG